MTMLDAWDSFGISALLVPHRGLSVILSIRVMMHSRMLLKCMKVYDVRY